jgi:DNA-binding CsgD family transcriptional regulator
MASEGEDSLGLVESVYDAAVDPAQWHNVLDRLCDFYPGGKASLVIHDLAAGKGVCPLYARWSDSSIADYNAHFGTRNPRFMSLNKWPVGRAAAAEVMYSRDALLKTEFYQDFLRPLEIPDGLGVTLFQDQSRFVRMSVLYPETTAADQPGNVARVQRLTPHLQRALQVNRQLANADFRWQAAEESLNRLASGVIIADTSARKLFINTEGCRILSEKDGLWIDRSGCICAKCTSDDESLKRVVRAAAGGPSEDPASAGGILRIRRPSGRRSYGLLVAPLRPPPSLFTVMAGAAAIFISDPEARSSASIEQLAKSFGLTAAQARLLLTLLEGKPPAEAAHELGVSLNTVKTHLRGLFAKMDCSRQADLIRTVMTHPTWWIKR